MTVVTINPGDGAPDVAALINATLNDPAVTEVVLGAGLFVLHSPISVPSGKTLSGAGRDLTILRAAEDFDRPHAGEYDGVVNTDMGAVGVSLHDFSIDANKLMPDGFRLVGCFMRQATDFTVARVDVYNTTGYAHFAQGDANRFTVYASGTYEDCATYNASIGFEQMAADGITLTNIVAGDGDGDLVGTYFHPLTGSKNITYINAYASGYGDIGFELTANVRAMDNIRIINSTVEMLGPGSALVVAGEFRTTNLVLEGSSFIAHSNVGAMLYGVQGTAVDSYFQGQAIGLAFFNTPHGIASSFVATASNILGINNPSGGAAAFGISTSASGVTWNGGSIEARGGAMIPTSGSVNLVGTSLITSGFDAVTPYTENAAAVLVAPALSLGAGALGGLGGGSLTIGFEVNPMAQDQLGIRNQGVGTGQIGVSGANVTYEGAVIGTFSGGGGGGGGEDLVISLGAGATAAAVQALARAITFTSAENNPFAYRALEFILVDGVGGSVELNTAISVTPVNDAPSVALYAPGANPFLNYVENGAPAALVPTAILADVDSLNFGAGSLKVEFTGNGTADDRLSVINQGSGSGQIGIVGSYVTYGGVPIGTFSGGTSGSTPLTIGFNVKATVAAVQALTRAIGFSNVSDTPSTAARTLRFTVNDGDGGASTAIATAKAFVLRTDDAAVAKNDSFSTGEDQAITGGDVFAHNGNGPDGDVDGPAIQVSQVNGSAAAVGNQIILPSGALLTLRANGTFDYDPNGLGSGLDSFTYKLGTGNVATVTITRTPVNDAPVIATLPGGESSLSYAENAVPAALAPGATIVDEDSANFGGGFLKVEFIGNGTAADRLTIIDQGSGAGQIGVSGTGITYGGVAIGTFAGGTDGATPLVVSLNSAASVAAVQALARAIAFHNVSEVPSSAARTLRFTIDDGDGGSSLATATAKAFVFETDDEAVAKDDNFSTSEGQAIVGDVFADNGNGPDGDVDGPAIQVGQVNGSGAALGNQIVLPSGALLTLRADGTFDYDPNGLGSGLDSFTYRLASGNIATVTVTNAGVNDSPTLTLGLMGAEVNVVIAENDPPAAIAPDAIVADVDSPNFDTGSLTVQFTANGTAADRLSILDQGNGAGQIGVAGNTVSYGGVAIGTFAGGIDGSTPLVVALNASASVAAVEALTRSIAFGNVSEDPSTASRTVSFTLTDGDGGSVQSTATSSVLPAQDPAFATDDSAATDENQTVAGSVLGNDGDVDGPAPQVGQVNGSSADLGQLITLGSGAKLRLNADGSYVYNPNGAFAYLVDPDSGAVGTTSAIDSFTYGLVDGGTATVTITVGGVNLAGEALYGDSGVNDIDGASFADLFRLEQGGADSASGLGGDDAFYFGATFGPADQVDGGAGTDTVAIQGNYGVGLVLGTGTTSNISGIEALSLLSGANTQFGDLGGNLYDYVITTLDSNVAAGVQFKINGGNLLAGEDLTVDGSAETDGNFLIYGGKGVDLLTGGAGNDVFFFAHEGRLGAGDHVDGGAGLDGLFLRGNFTIDFNDAAYSNLVRNVENFTLTSVSDTRYARSADTEFDYDIITDDDLVDAGLTVTFNGGQLQANETMKLDASHETDGHLRIFAGASNDILIGGAGNDLLFGGLGADILDGRAGSDTFRYNSIAESTGIAHDVLVGFDYAVDRLDLAGTHDSFESLNGGRLDMASFDADLASAMNGILGVNEAVFFTADSGDRAGSIFLIVDQNGVAGYQAGQDYVFDVTASPPPLGPLTDFIV